MGERGGRILVRMPPPMHDELAEAAEREGVSLNQHITNVLGSALHAEHQRGASGCPAGFRQRSSRTSLVTLVCVAAAIVLLVAWHQGW